MRAFLVLALLLTACQEKPGPGELTGTMSPEAEARRATETDPTPQNDTALTGTFGGPAAGQAPGTPAETGTHAGATGTDASTTTDPNVTSTGGTPPATGT
ncbi:MAG TPA: hypothetical protein VGF28_22380 [Thermoanaerobaculia bacterium]|jgi:hypothetical protein